MDLTAYYRFQGGNSKEMYNVTRQTFGISDFDKYVYLSASLKHHQYFTGKRVRQVLSAISSEELGLIVSKNNMRDNEQYRSFKNLILHSPNLGSLKSLKLYTIPYLAEMLQFNSRFQSSSKCKPYTVERVDRRVFNGGYGLCKEWLELFDKLTLCCSVKKITREDMIFFLQNLRYKLEAKENAINLKHEGTSKLIISENIADPFFKYQIIEAFEKLIDKGLIIDGDMLESSAEVGKQLVKSYLQEREKLLRDIKIV